MAQQARGSGGRPFEEGCGILHCFLQRNRPVDDGNRSVEVRKNCGLLLDRTGEGNHGLPQGARHCGHSCRALAVEGLGVQPSLTRKHKIGCGHPLFQFHYPRHQFKSRLKRRAAEGKQTEPDPTCRPCTGHIPALAPDPAFNDPRKVCQCAL
jgi:hypothetical protein